MDGRYIDVNSQIVNVNYLIGERDAGRGNALDLSCELDILRNALRSLDADQKKDLIGLRGRIVNLFQTEENPEVLNSACMLSEKINTLVSGEHAFVTSAASTVEELPRAMAALVNDLGGRIYEGMAEPEDVRRAAEEIRDAYRNFVVNACENPSEGENSVPCTIIRETVMGLRDLVGGCIEETPVWNALIAIMPELLSPADTDRLWAGKTVKEEPWLGVPETGPARSDPEFVEWFRGQVRGAVEAFEGKMTRGHADKDDVIQMKIGLERTYRSRVMKPFATKAEADRSVEAAILNEASDHFRSFCMKYAQGKEELLNSFIEQTEHLPVPSDEAFFWKNKTSSAPPAAKKPKSDIDGHIGYLERRIRDGVAAKEDLDFFQDTVRLTYRQGVLERYEDPAVATSCEEARELNDSLAKMMKLKQAYAKGDETKAEEFDALIGAALSPEYVQSLWRAREGEKERSRQLNDAQLSIAPAEAKSVEERSQLEAMSQRSGKTRIYKTRTEGEAWALSLLNAEGKDRTKFRGDLKRDVRFVETSKQPDYDKTIRGLERFANAEEFFASYDAELKLCSRDKNRDVLALTEYQEFMKAFARLANPSGAVERFQDGFAVAI